MPMTINGSGTITGLSAGGLPDATITQAELATGVAGTGPAFSAYTSIDQTFSASTYTVTNFQTEEFDTGGCFNNTASTTTLNGLSAPAYSFTPNVAGYYLIVGASYFNNSLVGEIAIYVYKNGAIYKTISDSAGTTGSYNYQNAGSVLVYLNGTGDYVQIYTWQTAGSYNHNNVASYTSYFQATLIRGA